MIMTMCNDTHDNHGHDQNKNIDEYEDNHGQVSITLTWKNGTGGKKDKIGGVRTQPFQNENSW